MWTVALRLDSGSGAGMTEGGEPTLDGLAAALDEPARPLFIGRKPCLPSARLCGGFVDAADSLAALLAVPLPDDADSRRPVRMQWPAREGGAEPDGVSVSRHAMLTDERNWVSGLHGGGRPVVEGTAAPGDVRRWRFLGWARNDTEGGECDMTTTTAAALRMVRGEVDLREFNRWMGAKRLQDPDHAMHCLLKECFGELAPKPFRLMATRGASVGSLYGYGGADAGALRDSAAICACPLQEQVMPPSSLASKPMPAEWREGLRLGFELRVRPVVRLQKDLSRVPPDKLRHFRTRPCEADAPRPGKECDVFQWEALDSSATLGMTRTREQVYVDWLDKQFERLRRREPGQGQDRPRVVPPHARRPQAPSPLQRRPRRADARRAGGNRLRRVRRAARARHRPAPRLRLRDAAAASPRKAGLGIPRGDPTIAP